MRQTTYLPKRARGSPRTSGTNENFMSAGIALNRSVLRSRMAGLQLWDSQQRWL